MYLKSSMYFLIAMFLSGCTGVSQHEITTRYKAPDGKVYTKKQTYDERNRIITTFAEPKQKSSGQSQTNPTAASFGAALVDMFSRARVFSTTERARNKTSWQPEPPPGGEASLTPISRSTYKEEPTPGGEKRTVTQETFIEGRFVETSSDYFVMPGDFELSSPTRQRVDENGELISWMSVDNASSAQNVAEETAEDLSSNVDLEPEPIPDPIVPDEPPAERPPIDEYPNPDCAIETYLPECY